MELKEFIEQTINSVIEGVSAAQNNHGGYVNNEESVGSHPRQSRNINFDIAVTVEEQKQSGVGGKISVWKSSVSGAVDESSNNQTVSKIKFDVPVMYPRGKIK